MSERENMQLLQTGARLACQRNQARPILLPLAFVQGVLQERSVARLVLFPARIKPEQNTTALSKIVAEKSSLSLQMSALAETFGECSP